MSTNYLRFLSEIKAPATLVKAAAANVTTSASLPALGNLVFLFCTFTFLLAFLGLFAF